MHIAVWEFALSLKLCILLLLLLLFRNNNPTMIAKANLFHYTNLMTELLYFIYFYWQAMFPHRLMQREEGKQPGLCWTLCL